MTDATPEHLLMILDNETAKKVWSHLRGFRIYFPKCKSKHDEINTLYNNLIRGIPRAGAVKRLSKMFEMSETQIRRITKKQGVLFEEDRKTK